MFWPTLTFSRYWFLWAKTRITLEMFPMLMVAMGQNIDYLDNGFHSNGCYAHSIQSLASIAVVLLSNQMEVVMKLLVSLIRPIKYF